MVRLDKAMSQDVVCALAGVNYCLCLHVWDLFLDGGCLEHMELLLNLYLTYIFLGIVCGVI